MEKDKYRETTIYQKIVLFIRICILLLLFNRIIWNDFQSIHYFITTFVFTYFDKIITKWTSFSFSNFINGFIIIFVFLSQILGRVFEFYTKFSFWDIFLHTLAGILFYYLGKEMILQLHHQSLKKGILFFFCFCFSLAIGSLWEIFEFLFDQAFHMNMQETRELVGVDAIVDTMSDLMVLTIGTIASVTFDNIRKRHKLRRLH